MTRWRHTAPFETFGWPIALALLIRLAAWLVIPASRFASDEDSYFQVGTALLQGRQDIFWPPVTGWLIALIRAVTASDSIAFVRIVWVALDTACVAGLYVLALRAGRAIWPQDESRATTLACVSAIGYAVYLAAVSFAQFATSEVPALLATLLMLLSVTAPVMSIRHYAVGGVFAGIACLTRPSLLPMLAFVPWAVAAGRTAYRGAVVFVIAGSMVIGAYVIRNWYYAGQFTISTNSAYNLFIGNRDMYAEDLDLFNPRATPEQIEFRRQQFSGQLPPFTQTPAESQRLALQWIADHPALFAKRALGRLARVFVPKTDVLELLGGEGRAGASSPRSLALLAVTNAQWAVILFGGLAGFAVLRRLNRHWARLFASVVAGALVLCLIAISKPRYSFVFDPLLIVCAVTLWMERDRAFTLLTRADRRVLAAAFAFLIWAWLAFAIFAVTSRAAL